MGTGTDAWKVPVQKKSFRKSSADPVKDRTSKSDLTDQDDSSEQEQTDEDDEDMADVEYKDRSKARRHGNRTPSTMSATPRSKRSRVKPSSNTPTHITFSPTTQFNIHSLSISNQPARSGREFRNGGAVANNEMVTAIKSRHRRPSHLGLSTLNSSDNTSHDTPSQHITEDKDSKTTMAKRKSKDNVPPKLSHTTPDEEDQVYCICRKGYNGKEFMLACDDCGDWFHGRCVKVTAKTVPKHWLCPKCVAKAAALEMINASRKHGGKARPQPNLAAVLAQFTPPGSQPAKAHESLPMPTPTSSFTSTITKTIPSARIVDDDEDADLEDDDLCMICEFECTCGTKSSVAKNSVANLPPVQQEELQKSAKTPAGRIDDDHQAQVDHQVHKASKAEGAKETPPKAPAESDSEESEIDIVGSDDDDDDEDAAAAFNRQLRMAAIALAQADSSESDGNGSDSDRDLALILAAESSDSEIDQDQVDGRNIEEEEEEDEEDGFSDLNIALEQESAAYAFQRSDSSSPYESDVESDSDGAISVASHRSASSSSSGNISDFSLTSIINSGDIEIYEHRQEPKMDMAWDGSIAGWAMNASGESTDYEGGDDSDGEWPFDMSDAEVPAGWSEYEDDDEEDGMYDELQVQLDPMNQGTPIQDANDEIEVTLDTELLQLRRVYTDLGTDTGITNRFSSQGVSAPTALLSPDDFSAALASVGFDAGLLTMDPESHLEDIGVPVSTATSNPIQPPQPSTTRSTPSPKLSDTPMPPPPPLPSTSCVVPLPNYKPSAPTSNSLANPIPIPPMSALTQMRSAMADPSPGGSTAVPMHTVRSSELISPQFSMPRAILPKTSNGTSPSSHTQSSLTTSFAKAHDDVAQTLEGLPMPTLASWQQQDSDVTSMDSPTAVTLEELMDTSRLYHQGSRSPTPGHEDQKYLEQLQRWERIPIGMFRRRRPSGADVMEVEIGAALKEGIKGHTVDKTLYSALKRYPTKVTKRKKRRRQKQYHDFTQPPSSACPTPLYSPLFGAVRHDERV
ncbi:hypothetical protein BZG36_00674 [Bifiguratus adelaidae]|uniref:PHD-type domain-containing protein n=1 Tax=Bifiguratus adelaidae TaxID=1938954 RepID=A0A261Y6Y3_9FUNG|nr:hypothetical protein BZG36_00674 [Bifiguratus adelaidae]